MEYKIEMESNKDPVYNKIGLIKCKEDYNIVAYEDDIRVPLFATYHLRKEHPVYPVVRIYFKTRLVTLLEMKGCYNTVDIKNVTFDFTGFTREEEDTFWSNFLTLEDMRK